MICYLTQLWVVLFDRLIDSTISLKAKEEQFSTNIFTIWFILSVLLFCLHPNQSRAQNINVSGKLEESLSFEANCNHILSWGWTLKRRCPKGLPSNSLAASSCAIFLLWQSWKWFQCRKHIIFDSFIQESPWRTNKCYCLVIAVRLFVGYTNLRHQRLNYCNVSRESFAPLQVSTTRNWVFVRYHW